MALAALCPRSSGHSVWEPVSIELYWQQPYGCGKRQRNSKSSACSSGAAAKDAPQQEVQARVDWLETAEAHVFKADLPGLKKEEVKVNVEDGNVLTISGQRAEEEAKETDKWHRTERSQGQFLRKFRLPKNVQLDEVTAGFENGVLTVTVPKVAERKPEVRSIDVAWS